MRLLALALLVVLGQDPPPVTRYSLTLANRSEDPIRAGTQVSVNLYLGKNAPKTGDLIVHYKGKAIAGYYVTPRVWFRLAADLPAGGRDANYELRKGMGPAPHQGAEVFEFFDDFAGGVLDPAKWEWDRDVAFDRGLRVTALPDGKNEHAPASFTPRLGSLDGGFVFEADVTWEIRPGSAFSFAVAVDQDVKLEVAKEDRDRIAAFIRELFEDDIDRRERATRGLVKLGMLAVPQLQEAAQSSAAETRQRAVGAIDAIYRENPPPSFTTGLLARNGEEGPDRMVQLGKARTFLKGSFRTNGSSRITLTRDPAGEASVSWTPGAPVSAAVEGKSRRIRLSFWSPRAEKVGEFRIARVFRRAYVAEMPTAEFGDPEQVK